MKKIILISLFVLASTLTLNACQKGQTNSTSTSSLSNSNSMESTSESTSNSISSTSQATSTTAPIPTILTILPSDFTKDSYDKNPPVTKVIGGINFAVTDIIDMKISQSNYIQFKKSTGLLANQDSLAVSKIVININKANTLGGLEVFYGNSADSVTTLAATTDDSNYNLNGATFFKIKCNGTGVVRLDSILIYSV